MTELEFRPPVVLDGSRVRLIPLAAAHAPELAAAADDPDIWTFLPYGPCRTPESMAGLIATLLSRQSAGTDLAFTVQLRSTGRLCGMTRYLSIDRVNRWVEIGGTWYAKELWRTPVNTEAKRLLLAHAFETEGVHRVQLKTDLRNDRSQRAIARLGAVREGILREHVRMPDGYARSSVVYGIVRDEWPMVRGRLDSYLRRPWGEDATGRGTTAAASP